MIATDYAVGTRCWFELWAEHDMPALTECTIASSPDENEECKVEIRGRTYSCHVDFLTIIEDDDFDVDEDELASSWMTCSEIGMSTSP